MIELRKIINRILKEYLSSVHYQQAPDAALFPYLTYEFMPSFTDGHIEVIPFDVDIWDDRSDTTELEEINDKIWKAFDRLTYNDANLQFSIYREGRQPIIDEAQPTLRRRKLNFQLRYFDKNI